MLSRKALGWPRFAGIITQSESLLVVRGDDFVEPIERDCSATGVWFICPSVLQFDGFHFPNEVGRIGLEEAVDDVECLVAEASDVSDVVLIGCLRVAVESDVDADQVRTGGARRCSPSRRSTTERCNGLPHRRNHNRREYYREAILPADGIYHRS